MKRLALLALAVFSTYAFAANPAACITGYQVEEGASPLATTWVSIGTAPSNASSLTITPATVGTHYYRVTMVMSDGTKVVSNIVQLKVTQPQTPAAPINLQLLFAQLAPVHYY